MSGESTGIAGQFCGQWQPHAAHWWQTPSVYGATTFISHYQCAGVAALAPTSEGGRDDG